MDIYPAKMADLLAEQQEFDELMLQCSKSIELSCKVLFPGRFTRPFSKAHGRLFELIDDRSIQRVLFIGHRGIGKSSLFNYAIPAREIIFHDFYHPNEEPGFIVPIGANATLSQMHANNLKISLVTSKDVKRLLGDVKSDTWNQEVSITSNDVMLMPRSPGGQIRGILYKDVRPFILIPDDLEKTDEVLSKEQRDKLKDWFLTDVINTIDRSRKDWRILMCGTILHEDSLLEDYRYDPDWEVVDAPLCDDECNTYWDTFMTTEEVKELKAFYKRKGKLDGFAREYLNKATAREDAVFKQEYFKYYDEGDLGLGLSKSGVVDNVVIIDPAKTAKVHNDLTAIIGIGINTERNAIYIRDIVNKHLHPDEIYEEAFSMAARLGASVIGYETTGLSEFIEQPMHDEMMRRGLSLELVELKARRGTGEFAGRDKGKDGRIAQLVVYYRTGKVYHNKTVCGVLEDQLMAFPRSKYKDVMDATAYVIQLMNLGERFWSHEPEYQGDTPMSQEEYEAIEEEALALADAAELELLLEGYPS